jgi:hypothetical protein
MQTFLPHPDFILSMKCLDFMRLGKQRVEAKQILNALEKLDYQDRYGYSFTIPWANHPATQMWRDYSSMLKAYHDVAILEWIDRGYNNTMPLFYTPGELAYQLEHGIYPPWFGNEDFHRAHQSNLMRKANLALKKSHELLINERVGSARVQRDIFRHYDKISRINNWTNNFNLPYIWPV